MAEDFRARKRREKREREMPEAIEQYLAEWRTLDFMEPRSPQEGWRDPTAIMHSVVPTRYDMRPAVLESKMADVVGFCERLADEGRVEVRCSDNGWIWYRQRRSR